MATQTLSQASDGRQEFEVTQIAEDYSIKGDKTKQRRVHGGHGGSGLGMMPTPPPPLFFLENLSFGTVKFTH